jgi:hypothetical protein
MPRPELDCCSPWKAPYPSGHHWTHSKRCPISPGAKVKTAPAPAPAPPAFEVTLDQIEACPLRSLSAAHYRQDGSCGCKAAQPRAADWGAAPPDVPERLAPSVAHPACIAAAQSGATPCARCSWLLEIDNEGARYIDAHLDAGRR